MLFNPDELSDIEQYKLMTGTIVPRPIALVTTCGAEGNNAAPFSLFNIAGTCPPMVMLSIGDQDDGSEKDTLRNVRANREFVVHIVVEDIAEPMNVCATNVPIDVDELVEAGFTCVPSVKVSPPRIAEAPVQMECRLLHVIDIGERHHVVIGEVVLFHYRDGIVNDRFHVDLERLKPIGRLSGPSYARICETFTLQRKYLGSAIPRS